MDTIATTVGKVNDNCCSERVCLCSLMWGVELPLGRRVKLTLGRRVTLIFGWIVERALGWRTELTFGWRVENIFGRRVELTFGWIVFFTLGKVLSSLWAEEFFLLFLFPGTSIGSALRPAIFTLCTLFGRMPGIEPELLRLQPGVLPMSYTHPMLRLQSCLIHCTIYCIKFRQTSTIKKFTCWPNSCCSVLTYLL